MPRHTALLLAVVIAPTALLTACSTSPEKAIRARLQAGADAVESGDRTAVVDMISDAYSDPDGNDQQAVLASLALLTRGQKWYIALTVSRIELLDGGTRARVVADVALAGRPVDDIAAVDEAWADLYRLQLEMVDENGVWRVNSARWQAIGLRDLL